MKYNQLMSPKKSNTSWLVSLCIVVILIAAVIINVQALFAVKPPTPVVPKQTTPAPKQADPVQKVETPQQRFSTITKEQRISRIPVLMYHDVQDIAQSTDTNVMTKVQFEAQLKYLKDNGFTTISAQEFIDAYNGKINLPKNSVMLTFDDGYKSLKTIINPLLKQYDFRAVSFIIGSYTNRPQWHLTLDEIKELQKDKLIDFESHTFDLHKDGKGKGIINETAVDAIVSDNKQIEGVIGHKTNFLCYPSGAFSNNAFEGLKAAQIPFGFAISSGVSNWVYVNETHTTTKGEVQNPLSLPRIRINANITIGEYANLITDN